MPPASGTEVTCEPERLPIIFGVTGHRDPRPADLEALRRTVARIFHDYRTDYPNTPFVLLSPLAEGADRLVAEVALEQPDLRLIAALPFEQPEYERDFVRQESLAEFRRLLGHAERVFEMSLAEGCTAQNIQTPDSDCRSRQYAAVGEFLARHSHILIALWDGTDNGKIGGTAWVKTKRKEAQKEASDRFQKADPLGYGPFLHVITPRLSNDTVPERACELASPLPRREKGEEESPPYQLVYGEMDEFNSDVLEKQRSAESRAEREKAAGYLYPEEKCTALRGSLQSMRALYATADGLAGLWQARTRRSLWGVILGVLFAGLAFEAVNHVIHPAWPETELPPRATLIFFLAASAFACWVRSRSSRQKQHDKYLNYRALAEALRVQFFWRLAGVRDSAGRHYEGRQWRELDWIRTAAHAQWVLSGADLLYRERGAAGAIADGIAQSREYWVMDQLRFFERRADSEEQRLHRHERGFRFGVGAGFLSGVGALLLLFFWHDPPPLWLATLFSLTAISFFCAGLIHFRAYKLALEAHARQYKESAQIFGGAHHRLEEALCGESSGEEGESAHSDLENDCLRILRHLGHEALLENADWVLTHRERPLEVPLG
jgi:hypothetical protein